MNQTWKQQLKIFHKTHTSNIINMKIPLYKNVQNNEQCILNLSQPSIVIRLLDYVSSSNDIYKTTESITKWHFH